MEEKISLFQMPSVLEPTKHWNTKISQGSKLLISFFFFSRKQFCVVKQMFAGVHSMITWQLDHIFLKFPR